MEKVKFEVGFDRGVKMEKAVVSSSWAVIDFRTEKSGYINCEKRAKFECEVYTEE